MTSINFSYQIKYLSFLGLPKRPYSPIKLIAPDGTSITVLGIIDSGADVCVFKPEVAETLGIDWSQGTAADVSGIEGSKSTAYQHKLQLQMAPMPSPTSCEVLFKENVPENLIGREGIFDSLYICFHQKNEAILLELV